MTANIKTGYIQTKTRGVQAFLQDDSGQNLIEYALIAGLIGLAAVVAMTSLGSTISNAFTKIGSQLTSAL